MNWWRRLLGTGNRPLPPHVQAAMDSAAAANASIEAGHAAVEGFTAEVAKNGRRKRVLNGARASFRDAEEKRLGR